MQGSVLVGREEECHVVGSCRVGLTAGSNVDGKARVGDAQLDQSCRNLLLEGRSHLAALLGECGTSLYECCVSLPLVLLHGRYALCSLVDAVECVAEALLDVEQFGHRAHAMLLLGRVDGVETSLYPCLALGVKGDALLGTGHLIGDVLEFDVEALHAFVPLLCCGVYVCE